MGRDEHASVLGIQHALDESELSSFLDFGLAPTNKTEHNHYRGQTKSLKKIKS
jgi:hypothetical protein